MARNFTNEFSYEISDWSKVPCSGFDPTGVERKPIISPKKGEIKRIPITHPAYKKGYHGYLFADFS